MPVAFGIRRRAGQVCSAHLNESLVVGPNSTGDDMISHRAMEQVARVIDEVGIIEVVGDLLGIPFNIDRGDFKIRLSWWMAQDSLRQGTQLMPAVLRAE